VGVVSQHVHGDGEEVAAAAHGHGDAHDVDVIPLNQPLQHLPEQVFISSESAASRRSHAR